MVESLRTKSIHEPLSPEDGFRISIMSRHTKDDGINPDPLITENTFDGWWKDLAPPGTLVGDYYKRGLAWEEFARHYLNFLKQDKQKEKNLSIN